MTNLYDTVLLGQVTEIRDRLERATAKMTQVVGIVEGNEPPKTGELYDQSLSCGITSYQTLKQELPTETSVLASRPVFQVKLKSILDKREPPQLLLITNKGGAEFAQ